MDLKVINHYSTLSAAIRAGAKLLPKVTGCLTATTREGHPGTCAIGAGLHALTSKVPEDSETEYRFISTVFRYLNEDVKCPDVGCRVEPLSVMQMVIHLNDGAHEWSREKIADWLEEWENANLGYETLVEAERGEEVSEPQVQHA